MGKETCRQGAPNLKTMLHLKPCKVLISSWKYQCSSVHVHIFTFTLYSQDFLNDLEEIAMLVCTNLIRQNSKNVCVCVRFLRYME